MGELHSSMPPCIADAGLCEYEQQRLERIRQNQAELKRLGIEDAKKRLPKRVKKTPSRKRSRGGNSAPARSSSRVAAQGKKGEEDDDYNPADSDEDGDGDDDESYRELPKPRKLTGKKPKTEATTTSAEASEAGLVVGENAKTGRSKCRKCMQPLPQGEPRVGMQAWIMGRQAITWQHPRCFASNIQVAIEETGRGKCRASKVAFTKGEPKLGLTSHTNTIWLKPSMASTLLAPALALVPDFNSEQVVGPDSLSKAQRAAVLASLSPTSSAEDKKAGKRSRSSRVAVKEEAVKDEEIR